MGACNCFTKDKVTNDVSDELVKEAREVQTEIARLKLQKISRIQEIKIPNSLRHSLPFPRIKSRLASAIICSSFARKKYTIKVLIMLNKESRAYIISQDGLPGFLCQKQQSSNFEYLMTSELQITCNFESEFEYDKKREGQIVGGLREHSTT